MTICIAAIAFDHQRGNHVIVTVSDTKLTTGFYSQDMATSKLRRVHDHWAVMIAGKFSQHNPLITLIRDELSKEQNPRLDAVAEVCTNAYTKQAQKMAEESILSNYGLSMTAFVDSRTRLGDVLFERLWGDIARVHVRCDLLVCGFDGNGPHIFSVSNPTEENPSFITYQDDPGFGSIGTGAYLAESTLFAFGQSRITPLNEAIYHTTFAKFVAESASDVGEATYLLAFEENGDRVPIDMKHDLEIKLRNRWIEKGKPSVPRDAIDIINAALPNPKQGDK